MREYRLRTLGSENGVDEEERRAELPTTAGSHQDDPSGQKSSL
jgi:hypothetical protein